MTFSVGVARSTRSCPGISASQPEPGRQSAGLHGALLPIDHGTFTASVARDRHVACEATSDRFLPSADARSTGPRRSGRTGALMRPPSEHLLGAPVSASAHARYVRHAPGDRADGAHGRGSRDGQARCHVSISALGTAARQGSSPGIDADHAVDVGQQTQTQSSNRLTGRRRLGVSSGRFLPKPSRTRRRNNERFIALRTTRDGETPDDDRKPGDGPAIERR